MSRQTPTTSAPRHRSLLKPMLGSLAGSVLLLLSLLWTDPSSINAPQIAATSASLQTDEPQTHLRPIEQVRLGERVHTDITPEQAAKAVEDPDSLPDWDRSDRPINRQDWRQIELSVPKADGHVLAISLLRPATWLTDRAAVAGSQINLVMPEMGIDGPATVLSIGDCPVVAPGNGSVVTGTFAHRRGGVLRVRLAGIEEPLGVTDNHPLYSLDREEFVPAGELIVGELLAVAEGATTIESIDEQLAAEQVYNLEVQGEHVYRVTDAGLLVHNNCALVAPKATVDLMAESGQLGGKLYGPEKLAKLQRYLERRGVYLDPARNGSFDGVKGVMTLPQNPTVLNVHHELSHMLDFRKYGNDYYKRFNSFEREEMVLDRLMDSQVWDTLNDAERNWSLLYPFTRPGGQVW